ncbi:hypothetical protein ACFXNW_21530 [Nocardia sp. NPDC059180]|uniref:hypothetical protein n=1 Tax=Nocardia sp. NPDC059180 TaxID=3346761 RepID=UPI003694633C
MTTSGDSANRPGAQGDQPNSTNESPQQPPVAPTDPTVLRQPGPPEPQHDPTLLRPFDQPRGEFPSVPPPGVTAGPPYGYAVPEQGFAQAAPGFAPSAQQQSGSGFAQPNAAQSQSSPPPDQFSPQQSHGVTPQNQAFLQGQGFPPQGQEFAPRGQGFSPQGQGFAPQGQGFSPQGQGFAPQGQGFSPQGQGFAAQEQGFAPGGFGPGGPGGPGFGPSFGPSGQGSSGASGRGWLWGLGGLVVASVVWGGAVLAFGAFGSSSTSSSDGVAPGVPDLRGYAYSGDFCDVSDTEPFSESGYTISTISGDSYPDFEGTEHAARDTMFCALRLVSPGAPEDDLAGPSLYYSVTIHKKTDPGPEFTAGFDTWENPDAEAGAGGRVEKISGVGDDAYVIVAPGEVGDPSPRVTIMVRDGWIVGRFTWSQYVSTSSSSRDSAKVLPESEVIDKLTESAGSTMAALRD